MNITRQIWGTALCLGCAALFVALFQGSRWKVTVPLLFIVVIAVISRRFGAASGILGSLGSALMFANFLFEPLHSLYVAEEHQRQNLLLMLVGGMLLAEILGYQQRKIPKRNSQPLRARDKEWPSGAPQIQNRRA